MLQIEGISSTVGSPTQITWGDSNGETYSGLNYALNGGTFTTCTGTVTGTGGVAIGPTIGTQSANSLVLQDASNHLNCSPVTWFPALSPPSGSGSLVASTAYNIVNPGSEYQITGTLSTPLNDLIFTWYQEIDCSVTGTTNGAPAFYLEVSSGGTTASNLTVAAGNWTATDGTPGNNQVYETIPLVSGPGTVTIGLTDSVSGTLTSTSTGTLTGYASNNGTAVLCQRTGTPQQTYTGWIIGTGVMYPFVPSVTFRGYLGIWALASETLSISTASYSSSMLSIGGACENATLTALNISTNEGASFVPATSLTVVGSNYSASLAGSLANGTYIVQSQDATTDVVSNFYTLLVTPQLNVSQVVEQVWLQPPPPAVRVSQIVEQVWLTSLPASRVGLFQSDVLPSAADGYIEFGSQMSWNWETSLLPDNQAQVNNSMQLTNLDMAFVGTSPVVSVSFNDSAGNLVYQQPVSPRGILSIWDASVWDVATWDGSPQPLSPWWVQWNGPIVFKQGSVQVSGLSYAGFRIGTLYMQYQVLRYVQQTPSGVR
jgi:hypothetical protein